MVPDSEDDVGADDDEVADNGVGTDNDEVADNGVGADDDEVADNGDGAGSAAKDKGAECDKGTAPKKGAALTRKRSDHDTAEQDCSSTEQTAIVKRRKFTLPPIPVPKQHVDGRLSGSLASRWKKTYMIIKDYRGNFTRISERDMDIVMILNDQPPCVTASTKNVISQSLEEPDLQDALIGKSIVTAAKPTITLTDLEVSLERGKVGLNLV
ncbi:hypothetical protein LPJ76_005972, partial [Coemansia sp. RSA 638]